jgi:hypothetical protein
MEFSDVLCYTVTGQVASVGDHVQVPLDGGFASGVIAQLPKGRGGTVRVLVEGMEVQLLPKTICLGWGKQAVVPTPGVAAPAVATLRDQFFMAALQGLLAAPYPNKQGAPAMVSLAWKLADQALKERDNGQ